MIEVTKIERSELDNLVRISYEGDLELFRRFHIRPNMNFEEAVWSTLVML